MKKIITYLTILMTVVACEAWGGEESSTPVVEGGSITIIVSDIADDSFSFTLIPSNESAYYSYLVDDSAQDLSSSLDASDLYSVSYSSIAQGTIKWTSDAPQSTIEITGLTPNTTYYIYAVAGSVEGVPGEIEVSSLKTSDGDSPYLVDWDYDSGDGYTLLQLEYSEDVTLNDDSSIKMYYYALHSSNFYSIGGYEGFVESTSVKASGNYILFTFDEIPPGAYFSVDLPDGMFADSAGNTSAAVGSYIYRTSSDLFADGIYGGFDEKALDFFGDATFYFADGYVTAPYSSDYTYYEANDGEGTITLTNSSKTVTYNLKYGTDFGWNSDKTILYIYSPEAPATADNVTVTIEEGIFVDIYGNYNSEWTATERYAYDYEITDITGTYSYYAESYYGTSYDSSGTFVIEELSGASDYNVKISAGTLFDLTTTTDWNGYFDTEAGTLTMEPGFTGAYYSASYPYVGFYPIIGGYYYPDVYGVEFNVPSAGSLSLAVDGIYVYAYDSSGSGVGALNYFTSFLATRTDTSTSAVECTTTATKELKLLPIDDSIRPMER